MRALESPIAAPNPGRLIRSGSVFVAIAVFTTYLEAEASSAIETIEPAGIAPSPVLRAIVRAPATAFAFVAYAVQGVD